MWKVQQIVIISDHLSKIHRAYLSLSFWFRNICFGKVTSSLEKCVFDPCESIFIPQGRRGNFSAILYFRFPFFLLEYFFSVIRIGDFLTVIYRGGHKFPPDRNYKFQRLCAHWHKFFCVKYSYECRLQCCIRFFQQNLSFSFSWTKIKLEGEVMWHASFFKGNVV